MIKLKIPILPLVIISVGVLIALIIIFYPQIEKKGKFKTLSLEESGEKVLRYFNSYLLKDRDKAILIGSSKESGVYRFKLKVKQEEFEVFTTKDGKFLFVGFADLSQIDK